MIAATGFLSPPLGAIGDGPFDLLAVFPDGSAVVLPRVEPLVQGTNGADHFDVHLKNGDPSIVQVTRGNQTTQFLTVTNPVITIDGGKGSDSLDVRYSTAGPLPTIAFDGNAGYDTVQVFGTNNNDTITLLETSDFSSLPAGVIALRGVEYATVWGGKGNDFIDARGLTTINTTLYGEAGNDTIYGGGARDIIYGGLGNDSLHGRRGYDQLIDNSGRDLFDFWWDNWFDNWFGNFGNIFGFGFFGF